MLRFLCFNIHGGYSLRGGRDFKRVHALMDKLDVDVGVFQEMETRPSRGGAAQDIQDLSGPDRPYYLSGRSMADGDGWYGNLIVSRYPILRGLVHDLETKIDLEPRNAVDALIDTRLGEVRIIGTHLSLSPLERQSEVRNLLRLMDRVEETENNPVFLMGDINEWRLSSRLLRHLDGLMTSVSCGPTFPSILPVFRLDRVWCDAPAFEVAAKTVTADGARHLSDHLPVLVSVSPV